MSLNISLYTVSAVLILDNEGGRVFAKYYQSPEDPSSTDGPLSNLTGQTKFEKSLFEKINKMNQDIILYDNHLVTYKQTNDVIIVVVAKLNENESLIYSLCANLLESLTVLLDRAVDKLTILEKFDMVALCVDETIDDGIILEIDPAIVVSRVTNPPSSSSLATDTGSLKLDLSERGFMNALSFASKKIGERLQQGL
ncbi:Golgi-to-ER vesicle coat component [Scheffersomyces spartinae]|uniref:Coatomer subunit zeta n=1 Tax=Scheffersomyces spartinae TaxID=45513 RepID=A0A9P7VA27_9ASCO|nr:Golgi-to-ER vesicle coat component [Scheffersomyces spartinae]KAG7194138.1 Golgi-to-ER vesicle coat component [Scheffersomyces spartinae]